MELKKLASKIQLDKSELFMLLGLTLLAFIVRMYFLGLQQVIMDDVEYAVLGKNMISGKGYVGISDIHNTNPLFYPILIAPFYPLMIGIFSLIIKDLELAGRLVSLMFGVLLVIPVYFLARNFYNKKVGYIASIFIVFCSSYVHFSTMVMSESTYTFLLISGIFIAYYALNSFQKYL
ncbi:MAG: glycosyltransferase family 39 protein [Methanocellales archaeon]|nr:glycosyltransferase family 39 protein [Methanocellales archaeon]